MHAAMEKFGKHMPKMAAWLYKKGVDPATIKKLTGIEIKLCFVAGTKVLTDSGFVRIENIQVGDSVWAYENGMKKLQRVYSE